VIECTDASTVSRSLVAKKTLKRHVSDMRISHFSSSESNGITSKKEEEYQTEQFESTLLKRMTKEEKARKRTRGPYRKSSNMQ